MRKSLRILLRQLHDRIGLTSIFVTHDQAEALEMADRVAVLHAGRLLQVDAPDKLYAEPASAFVHEFLGESVRLDCTVKNGQAWIEGLPDLFPTKSAPGPAIALIRPHEVGLFPRTRSCFGRKCASRRTDAPFEGPHRPSAAGRAQFRECLDPRHWPDLPHRPIPRSDLHPGR